MFELKHKRVMQNYPLGKTKGKAENFNACMPISNLCGLERIRGSVDIQQGILILSLQNLGAPLKQR